MHIIEELNKRDNYNNELEDVVAFFQSRVVDLTIKVIHSTGVAVHNKDCNKKLSEKTPVELLSFVTFTWEDKQKLLPHLNHYFVEPKEKTPKGNLKTLDGVMVVHQPQPGVKRRCIDLPRAEVLHTEVNGPIIFAEPLSMSKATKNASKSVGRKRTPALRYDVFFTSGTVSAPVGQQKKRKTTSTFDVLSDRQSEFFNLAFHELQNALF
ncbi:hypothetical protein FRX31_006717 [Thalictrum thalictroides]|uniref:Uncharacterized protein n=1 Tax=Thalictrum thalictroides TaxID=46969 RepID=A0A7J6X1U6_THATH|nr:hypothetical protein FRX31_006717 [Thalictrum thalictroides]